MDKETRKKLGMCDEHGFTNTIDERGVGTHLKCPLCRIKELERAAADQETTNSLLVEEKDKYLKLYLEQLELVEEWQMASGLVDGSGDPGGVTPKFSQAYWLGVEEECKRLRPVETAARVFVEYDGEKDHPDYLHWQEHFDALKAALEGGE
jgi:hypothetical protein